MVRVDTVDMISISEATKRGVSALVREAEAGRQQVILRHSKPVAAVVSTDLLEQLQRLHEELLDVSQAAARVLTTSSERHSLDAVLARFGYTREQLSEL